MSWEHPTKEEHKTFSSCYHVWYGACPHDDWDMRWHHEKTYQNEGGAFRLARLLEEEDKAVRIVQHWWDGETFQSDVIYEAL